jgi:cob(I)alamin adenosyltransferase
MRIYTRTGDKGDTGLVGGKRVPKESPRIEAIGTLDELNATLGICMIHAKGTELEETLCLLQNWLFDLGSELATPRESKCYAESVQEKHVKYLEDSIDKQTAHLEPLKNFILPGGSDLAAYLHLARCVCRRAERCVLRLPHKEEARPQVLAFLNRLSDWFFVAARTANRLKNIQDIKWEAGSKL